MYPEDLAPKSIIEIVTRLPEYVDLMDRMNEDEVSFFLDSMREYVLIYMNVHKIDKALLKSEAVTMLHSLYLVAHEVDYRSERAIFYGEEVLSAYFFELLHQGVYLFGIFDDEMSDDLFLFMYSLLSHSSFTIIVPYVVKGFDEHFRESTDTTKLPVRSYSSVEGAVFRSLKDASHIIYLEKDTSVSYMHKLLDIVETIRHGYQCVYRTKPYPYPHALWVHGEKREMIG
jgi:hypothetical protein